tara:strand:- start:48 stop:788 length:741 start_codon:yes stop_codon:yes gene_type:complete
MLNKYNNEITLSEKNGIRYLHFGTKWIQGAMKIDEPDGLVLEYTQQMMAWMLFKKNPKKIAQLGMGTGSLTKFSLNFNKKCLHHVIEINEDVIKICKKKFKLPVNHNKLSILNMNANDFVNDSSNHKSIDILQIDLYDKNAQGPVLNSFGFYNACHKCLTDNGISVINLFGNHPSFQRNFDTISKIFDATITLPKSKKGNIVLMAFKRTPSINFQKIFDKSKEICLKTKLPTDKWITEINTWLKKD